MKKIKQQLFKILFSNRFGKLLLNAGFKLKYGDSSGYWQQRYLHDGTSGTGSYGALAQYKADFINPFVQDQQIQSVIELGCGDGNQLQYFIFPSYTGLDVSAAALQKCIDLFRTDSSKQFFPYSTVSKFTTPGCKAELALSLDVIYHLLEEEVYEKYMQDLFAASSRFVIIYAWDIKKYKSLHIRHREFTPWIATHFNNWQLKEKIEYKGKLEACDFFVYEKIA